MGKKAKYFGKGTDVISSTTPNIEMASAFLKEFGVVEEEDEEDEEEKKEEARIKELGRLK